MTRNGEEGPGLDNAVEEWAVSIEDWSRQGQHIYGALIREADHHALMAKEKRAQARGLVPVLRRMGVNVGRRVGRPRKAVPA